MKPQHLPSLGLWGVEGEGEVGGWNNVLPFTPTSCQDAQGGLASPLPVHKRPGKEEPTLQGLILFTLVLLPALVGTWMITHEETGTQRHSTTGPCQVSEQSWVLNWDLQSLNLVPFPFMG